MPASTYSLFGNLVDNDCQYQNPHGVTIEVNDDETIILRSPFKGESSSHNGIFCNFYRQFNNEYWFQHFFEHHSLFELNSLTPEYLQGRYCRGEIGILCRPEDNEALSLRFQLSKDRLSAIDEVSRQRIMITDNLVTRHDFIRYAKQYFRKRQEISTKTQPFSLYTYLKEHGQIIAGGTISIHLVGEKLPYIYCPYPGYNSGTEAISFAITATFETDQDFHDFFPFRDSEDLHKLTAQYMVEKFEHGEARALCFLELEKFGGNLSFTKKDTGMLAADDYYAKELPAPGHFFSVNDFVAFTLQYCVAAREWRNG